MRNLITIVLLFVGVSLFGQVKTDTPAKAETPKKDVVYLTPEQTIFDTLQVVGIEVQFNQPLYAQTYELISLIYVYSDGTKKVNEKWIERVVNGKVVQSWRGKNIANHFCFLVSKEQFEQ